MTDSKLSKMDLSPQDIETLDELVPDWRERDVTPEEIRDKFKVWTDEILDLYNDLKKMGAEDDD